MQKEIAATMNSVPRDQLETRIRADKIVVLREGRIEQMGAPLDRYRDPETDSSRASLDHLP